jgi:hypothetical protein
MYTTTNFLGKFFLIVLLTTSSLIGFSKNKKYISLEDQNITIKNSGFYLKKVINATGNNTFIGFISRSVNGKGITTYFEKDISDEVFDFLRRNLEESKENTPLIIRIDELKISEIYPGGSEFAMIKIAITFFFIENGNYVKKFSANITNINKRLFSLSKHQPEFIAQAIAQCFSDFYNRATEGKLENIVYSEEELYHDPHQNTKVINEYFGLNRTQKGLYETFYDFRYATPDTTVDFIIEYKKFPGNDINPTIKYTKIYTKDSKKAINKVWGFCDGKNNYLNIENRYYPLHKDNNSYFLYAKVSDNVNAYNFGAGIGGSLNYLGYTIHSTSIGSNSKLRLNLLNGLVEYVGHGIFSTKVSDRKRTQIVFFSSRFNTQKSQIAIYINSELQCQLKKGEWFAYVFPSSDSSIMIDIISSDGKPLSMEVYPKPYDTIILLCHDKKHKEPVVERLKLQLKNEYEELMTEKNRACSGQTSGE